MRRRILSMMVVTLLMTAITGCGKNTDSPEVIDTKVMEAAGENVEDDAAENAETLEGTEEIATEEPVTEESSEVAPEEQPEESKPADTTKPAETTKTSEATTPAQPSENVSATVTVTTPAKPTGTGTGNTAQATAQATTPSKPQTTPTVNQTPVQPATSETPTTEAPATEAPVQTTPVVSNDPSQRQNIQSKYLGGNNDAFARSLLTHVNTIRRANGVPELVWDETVAANAKANAMRNMLQGYMKHGDFNNNGPEACGRDYDPYMMAWDPYGLVEDLTTYHTQGIVENPNVTKAGIGIVVYLDQYNNECAYITIRAGY